MEMPAWLKINPGRTGSIIGLAVQKFLRIDGNLWASAFAFDAFFSLFPLIVLFATVASVFIEQERAASEIIAYLEGYLPLNGEMQNYVFSTVAGVIAARGKAGAVALVVLVWSALQCFTTLISATTRAWGEERHSWWRLPLKSLVYLAILVGVVLLGVILPMLLKAARELIFPTHDFSSWVYAAAGVVAPLFAMALGLGLFYRTAPRRWTPFCQVWVAAVGATLLLQAAASLFVLYLRHFATFNAVYGAFGGIMALLLWIYLSGAIFIFGACLSAAQADWKPQEKVPGGAQ